MSTVETFPACDQNRLGISVVSAGHPTRVWPKCPDADALRIVMDGLGRAVPQPQGRNDRSRGCDFSIAC